MFKINRKILFITTLTILVILIIYFLFNKQDKEEPKIDETSAIISIISSNPENNSLGFNVFDPITITFNQPVDSSRIKVFSEPSETWNIKNLLPNTIQVESKKYLRVATKYRVSIYKEDLNLGSFSFETNHEQNDPRLLQELKTELDQDYPLITLTPYENKDYRIVYVAPLTLEITINENNKTANNEDNIIKGVKSWIRSNKIDPETHKYIIK